MYNRETLAMILAGGEGRRLGILSEKRAKPAVPFGGKYRIIDFCLSNCVNSGIYCLGVLTQYNPHSLHDHIKTGKAWDLDRVAGGVFLLQPYIGDELTNWYRGTADAIYQNLRFIRNHQPRWVLILSGDHIYTMDYRKMIRFHIGRGADLTLGGIEVPWKEIQRFGIMTVDEEGRVKSFLEKPTQAESNLASMGIYIFNREILEEEMEREASCTETSFDFGKDLLPRLIQTRKVYAYTFKGYWKDVGTLDAYWAANMELLESEISHEFTDRTWPIYTPVEDRPPVKFGPSASVASSIIGDGAIINGKVRHSIIFGGVYISEEAEITNSIIMNDARMERKACIDRTIIDKLVVVGESAQVGWGLDMTQNLKDPDVLYSGLSVIGKNTRIPAGIRIGRNCRIGADLVPESFPSLIVESGQSVELDR
ncbi:MAG TPA: glucose-1-phosphate adenylyltransferase [Atribacteraceae bacterium]|nr:glucose-1-phosphate adenylyltransferase [Atribacteraceae bacterium]